MPHIASLRPSVPIPDFDTVTDIILERAEKCPNDIALVCIVS